MVAITLKPNASIWIKCWTQMADFYMLLGFVLS